MFPHFFSYQEDQVKQGLQKLSEKYEKDLKNIFKKEGFLK